MCKLTSKLVYREAFPKFYLTPGTLFFLPISILKNYKGEFVKFQSTQRVL